MFAVDEMSIPGVEDVGLAGRPQQSNMSSLTYLVYSEYVSQNSNRDVQDDLYGKA